MRAMCVRCAATHRELTDVGLDAESVDIVYLLINLLSLIHSLVHSVCAGVCVAVDLMFVVDRAQFEERAKKNTFAKNW